MEPPPMILPKGIVFNIDRVYKEVASYTVVPPEKIYEYWHVYTTTFGKLKDPTANRLENFWWHVMGSDRSLLPGPILARIFEQISNGPTFVPLRGPPNRYEGPSIPTMFKKIGAAGSQAEASDRQSPGGKGSPDKTETFKAMASSSLKPPPSHPILKKPRGPSSAGPRPTARFVSPAGSDAEDDKKESEADSSTSAAGTTDNQPKSASTSTTSTTSTTRDRLKRPVGGMAKKKIVASSSSKRRPAMPRRQSSQSSATGSEVGSREERSSLTSRYLGSQRSVSPIAEKPGKGITTKAKDDPGRLSAKAISKHPVATAGTTESEKSQVAAPTQVRPGVTQGDVPETHPAKSKSKDKGKEAIYEKSRMAEGSVEAPHRRSDAQERAHPEMKAPPMARCRSDIGAFQRGAGDSRPVRRVPPQGLTSTTTATTSNVAAHGTIIEFDENAPARAIATAIQNDMPEEGLRRSGSTATSAPTAPSNTPSVPLGRSKSQLTLLLERQNDKKSRR
ncbi:hypothetical protein SCUP515_08850 [Seiridium cupressi]